MKQAIFAFLAFFRGEYKRAIPAALILLASTASAEKPNILLIMADDMGYSDIGCFGSEIPTPNLDRLAANGVRMANFHNAARCCPSRATIVTGQYPQRVGIGYMTQKTDYPGYQPGLVHPHTTIAKVAGSAGYATGISGKWHLSVYGPKRPEVIWQDSVRAAGFEWLDTISPSGTSFFYPFDRSGSERAGEQPTEEERKISGATYVTDWYGDGVLNYLDRTAKDGRPFMIYWVPTAPHYPLQCKQSDLERMKGLYDGGPPAVAEARYARLLKEGLVDPSWPWEVPEVVANPDREWRTDVRTDADPWPPPADYRFHNGKNKKMGCARSAASFEEMMEIYAAQVVALDDQVGRVIERLEKSGRLENTFILFCSDNGSSNEKQTTGHAWAQVSNTPYPRYKRFTDGGGIRTPLVLHWPAGTTPEARGSVNRTYGHLIDVLPTVLELTDAAYPASDEQDRPIPPLPGRSLLPVLKGAEQPLDAPLFFEHSQNLGVVTEEWKLVSQWPYAWRLYHTKVDQLEQHDIAAKHPDKVRELALLWQAWADANNVRPGGHKRKLDRLPADTLQPSEQKFIDEIEELRKRKN